MSNRERFERRYGTLHDKTEELFTELLDRIEELEDELQQAKDANAASDRRETEDERTERKSRT